jgi:hypothetical protein
MVDESRIIFRIEGSNQRFDEATEKIVDKINM